MSEILRDMQQAAPLLVIATMAVVLMLVDAFSGHGRRDHLGWISLLGIAATLGMVIHAFGDKARRGGLLFEGMLVWDDYALFAAVLFLSCAAITILLSMHYLREQEIEHGEYYVLVLFAVVGMMVMAAASDLVTLFLGLETMSVSTYVLVGFRRQSERSVEGAMKYFLLGAFATAVLLYGVALIYGATGTTSLPGIAKKLAAAPKILEDPYLLVGMVLLLVALGFKVASVPFHMWTPDAYEGAPTSVTAFMACAVKAAGFAALVRIFTTAFAQKGLVVGPHGWFTVVAVVCVLTMVVGNLVAIAQKGVKRMLAYSSIGHAGYLLLGLLACAHLGEKPASTVLFYLFAYSFTVLGAFGVVLVLERRGREDPLKLEDFSGLGHRHPFAGLAMTVFLLSLTGVPPTAGFFAKFYLFRAAVQAGGQAEALMYTLVIIAVLSSAAAAFYYLRVVVYMYFREPEGETSLLRSPAAALALALAALAVLAIGLLPDPYLVMGEKAAGSLAAFGRM